MDGRPNRRNKAAFSNFSGVLGTGPRNALTSIDTVNCEGTLSRARK